MLQCTGITIRIREGIGSSRHYDVKGTVDNFAMLVTS